MLPPQLKQIYARYKIMCSCECCISDKSIHSSSMSWRDRYLKNSRIKAKIPKVEGLVREHIKYIQHIKNTVMPHGSHIYATSSDMKNATMCTYP